MKNGDELEIDCGGSQCPSCTCQESHLNISTINQDNYAAQNTIASTATISQGSNVSFKAGAAITLNSGFYAQAGGNFLATIEACSSTLVSPSTNEVSQIQASINQLNLPIHTPIDVKIYPNPFTTETNISYQLPENTLVNIILMDYNGSIIKHIIHNQAQDAGTYATSISSDNLLNGLYYIHLRTNNEIVTKKLMLLK